MLDGSGSSGGADTGSESSGRPLVGSGSSSLANSDSGEGRSEPGLLVSPGSGSGEDGADRSWAGSLVSPGSDTIEAAGSDSGRRSTMSVPLHADVSRASASRPGTARVRINLSSVGTVTTPRRPQRGCRPLLTARTSPRVGWLADRPPCCRPSARRYRSHRRRPR